MSVALIVCLALISAYLFFFAFICILRKVIPHDEYARDEDDDWFYYNEFLWDHDYDHHCHHHDCDDHWHHHCDDHDFYHHDCHHHH